MQLEGSLSQFPLRELIEMAVYSSVSGVLEVQVGDDVGRIFFRDGLPQHAELSGLQGVDAIGRMFAERDASFRFSADGAPVTPTLWMDPWEIIELAEHQAQTWALVRPYVPALGAIPTLRMPLQRAQSLVGEDIAPLLTLIDGQRSIPDIARDLSVTLIDVYVGIASLVQQQIVVLASLSPLPTAPPPEPNSDTGEKRDGFFERLLARALEEERRKSEPRISEPRISEPRISEPRISEPRQSEPRQSEPRRSGGRSSRE
ncbi:MAG: hypothetical protein KatS3mg058_0448 [Roseiflexus sp.]|nr:DUF4388 domain-containing protein [Roseiflexus sp.]GIV99044.1 MAG: hypothetical protein KatS3mg058_0448 [Roseiflexus sp.]